jgi:hypothetical protein
VSRKRTGWLVGRERDGEQEESIRMASSMNSRKTAGKNRIASRMVSRKSTMASMIASRMASRKTASGH